MWRKALLLTSLIVLPVVVMATPASASGQRQTATAVLSPHRPNIICCGGGGWPYSDTAYGDCGSATISGNPLSDGKVEMQAQLVSTVGPITGGEVKITWGGRGGSGTILFYPVASDGNWVSSVETKQVDNGATMGITLSGYIYVDGGEAECFIENPAISVPT